MSSDFYQDKARKLLIYPTTDTRIMNHIPGAWPLDIEHVVVPHSLYAVQILAWLGYPVPPILDDDGYDWPHNKQFLPGAKSVPTHAQRIMANFCAAHPRCFNLSDMGTMKTLATLWAADYLMRQHPPGTCRALIVAKLSTLQRTWGDTLFQHFTGRRTFQIIHHPSAKRRCELLAKPADFYIVNPDGIKVGCEFKGRNVNLGGFAAQLFARRDIKICAIDEASAFRDRRSGRSRVMQAFCHPTRMPYVWPLTGTPTPDKPTDAYGIAKLVNDAFGISYKEFEAQTMVQVNLFKKLPARGSYEKAAALLQPAVRFDIRDVWDGPKLSVIQREVQLTDHQKKVLKDLKHQLALQMKSGATITPANEAAMRLKALQIMQGAVYDDSHSSHTVDPGHRVRELLDLIDDATRKVLVFAPFTNVINMLVAKLTEAKQKCIKLNGQVPPKERDKLLLEFRDNDDVRCAVCDPQTVSHGLNQLVAATTVCWYGATDKTELYLQGNARAYRPGQMFPVTIAQLVASKLERDIYKRLNDNETMQGVLLDWIRSEDL